MRALFLLITIFVCASCSAQDPYVVLKGQRFTVEWADTSDKQALGMMFREHLADYHGMLFLFPVESRRSFWMKNTRIPLDIFYFDEKRQLLNVAENARPCRSQSCPRYLSEGPAMYVLELNGGKAAELGVLPGDVLELHIE